MSRYLDFDHGTHRLPPIFGYWNAPLVSLEESLKPISSDIDELSHYIKVAKERCHFPSEHGLTRDESAAIYLYSMEWGKHSLYKLLNEALRAEDRSISKKWFLFLKLFNRAVKKLRTVTTAIWRGVPKDLANRYKKDQKLIWWGVSSCSTFVNVIESFIGSTGTLFLIEARRGKDIRKYTSMPHEAEVLLMPGTHLRVEGDSYKHSGGLNVVHLKEISPNEEELPSSVSKPHIPHYNPPSGAVSSVIEPGNKPKHTIPHKPNNPNNPAQHPGGNGGGKQYIKGNPRSQSSIGSRRYSKPISKPPFYPKHNQSNPNLPQSVPNIPVHSQQYPAVANHVNLYQPLMPVLSNIPSNSVQIFNYPDGTYEGTFSNGLRHGHGTFHCRRCGHVYVGSWANDKPNGPGVASYPNGTRYQGNWKDGMKNGYGTYQCGECGHVYVGNFMNDLMNGQGVFTWKEGWRYEGSFLNGTKHGSGAMVYPNGVVIAGNWFNDAFMG